MTTTASWFHCSVKPVSRSAGRSIVAAAAYRLGERLEDKEYGLVHDYRRRGGVETSFTLAPDGAPGWAFNPERLWNEAEASEKRKNSRVGRECEVALPASLDVAGRERISVNIAQALIGRYGVAVSVGIHRAPRDNGNEHAHFLMTSRAVGPDGLTEKTRALDDRKTGPEEVKWIRATVADIINNALEEAGSDERVTHLSFEARGINREATEHLGPSAAEMERREPGSSDRGDRNRDIKERNQTLDQLVAELAELAAEIARAEEQELDARYGPAEPHTEASAARDPGAVPSAEAASFDAAIRRDIEALRPQSAEVWTSAPTFENAARADIEALQQPAPRLWKAAAGFAAAILPAIASERKTGETWPGARAWQRAAEIYHRSMAAVTDIGREVFDYWRRYVSGDRDDFDGRDRESDGPER